MSYKLYGIEDFASDTDFRNWVLHPNYESNYFWERWIINNPDKKTIIEKAIVLVKAVQFEETNFSRTEKENLFSKIENTIRSQKSQNTPVYRLYNGENKRNRKLSNIIYRLAAVFIGIVIVAAFLITNLKVEKPVLVEETNSTIMKEITKGQKMRIYLPDGSIVFLNSSSKISYPEKFVGNTREVKLTGEAFFEIAKDPSKHFIVKTDGLTTSVLGTSFNISSYPDNELVSVSLVSGKVVINKEDSEESLTLEPGESIGLNKRTGEIAKTKFEYISDIAWKDGILYFKETSIKDVFDRLEQWYGVTIIVEKIPQGVKPINGRFNDEYLNNVLMSIGHAVNFDYRISGNEVYVKFK